MLITSRPAVPAHRASSAATVMVHPEACFSRCVQPGWRRWRGGWGGRGQGWGTGRPAPRPPWREPRSWRAWRRWRRRWTPSWPRRCVLIVYQGVWSAGHRCICRWHRLHASRMKHHLRDEVEPTLHMLELCSGMPQSLRRSVQRPGDAACGRMSCTCCTLPVPRCGAVVCAASGPGGGGQAASGVLRILLHHVMGLHKMPAACRLQQPRAGKAACLWR